MRLVKQADGFRCVDIVFVASTTLWVQPKVYSFPWEPRCSTPRVAGQTGRLQMLDYSPSLLVLPQMPSEFRGCHTARPSRNSCVRRIFSSMRSFVLLSCERRSDWPLCWRRHGPSPVYNEDSATWSCFITRWFNTIQMGTPSEEVDSASHVLRLFGSTPRAVQCNRILSAHLPVATNISTLGGICRQVGGCSVARQCREHQSVAIGPYVWILPFVHSPLQLVLGLLSARLVHHGVLVVSGDVLGFGFPVSELLPE